MSLGAEASPLDALLRLVTAQAPDARAALFAQARTGPEFIAGDESLAPTLVHILAIADGSAPARDSLRVVAAPLPGLPRGACALAALPTREAGGAGWLLLSLPTRRAVTPARRALLADAALVAARHLPHRVPADGQSAPAAILPRADSLALIEAGRDGADGVSVLLVDLDRFHAVNDALGLATGDAVLAALAGRIAGLIGPQDRLARIEGDRFLVVTRGSACDAEALAERLLDGIGQPLDVGGRRLVVHASIGVVSPARPHLSAAVLLTQAAAALRRAKAEGRNRVVRHAPGLAAAALAQSRLEIDLADAPARGQMRLAYQPYVDLATGRIAGVEALLRWQHPTRGTLAPADFIPRAEATGLILPLGAWALRAALTAAAAWPVPLTVAVNISALQFHQAAFVDQVAAALAATGVPPQRLELEITETVLMRDADETTAQLAALIGMGVRIALDDFGTGYSALAYLSRLPHHRIKLDRSFVADLGNPATTDLIAAIIALARKTGTGVTAEGVERPDQLALVRGLGFTHAQGYATGCPVPDPAALMEAV